MTPRGTAGETLPPRDPRPGECRGAARGSLRARIRTGEPPQAAGAPQAGVPGRVSPGGRGDRGVTGGGSSRWEGALGAGVPCRWELALRAEGARPWPRRRDCDTATATGGRGAAAARGGGARGSTPCSGSRTLLGCDGRVRQRTGNDRDWPRRCPLLLHPFPSLPVPLVCPRLGPGFWSGAHPCGPGPTQPWFPPQPRAGRAGTEGCLGGSPHPHSRHAAGGDPGTEPSAECQVNSDKTVNPTVLPSPRGRRAGISRPRRKKSFLTKLNLVGTRLIIRDGDGQSRGAPGGGTPLCPANKPV